MLFNNAGVMNPPGDKKTAQGYDMQLGTNCLGHFLFTTLLTPNLQRAAAIRPRGTVRVVWVASMAAELYSVKHGIDMSNLRGKDYVRKADTMTLYGNSKAGNYLHSFEYARQHKDDNIISVVSLACRLLQRCCIWAPRADSFLRRQIPETSTQICTRRRAITASSCG